MKNILMATILLLTTTSAFAGFSGSVSATNDYIWRGMGQGADMAFQIGLDYEHESGLYAGVWTSDVDFGGDVDREIDYYAGYSTALVEGVVDIDVGYIKYDYQGVAFDFEEIMYGLSFANGLTVNYYNTESSDVSTIELIYAVPFITVVDVELIAYDFEGNGTDALGSVEDSVAIRFSKSLDDNISFGLLVGEDLLTGDNYYAFSFNFGM
mgnify:FL=1|jgi:hypothetical protein|tara:strand:+ start:122 stop:751 length:630 start_codon:yes stop_codon:yes gene_type:complete